MSSLNLDLSSPLLPLLPPRLLWDSRQTDFFFPFLVLDSVTSGGATINDGFTHASIPTMPFGGVGSSGTGQYRGRASFDVFTHRRSVAVVPAWVDKLLRVRYMPYSPKELARLRRTSSPRCDFDRAGRPIRGLRYWLGLFVGLGSASFTGALFKWAVALVGLFVARQRGLLDMIRT